MLSAQSCFNSGNVLGNRRTTAEIRRLRTSNQLSRAFPETRKHHAAAYRECGQLVEYERTLNVEPIGGGPADSGR